MPAAYVLMPVSAKQAVGPAAIWVTAAGWAAAAETRLGSAVLLSPDGAFTPAEALRHATELRPAGRRGPTGRRRPPEVLITLAKDVRAWRNGRRFARDVAASLPTDHVPPSFVWQQHNLFQFAGLPLARALGAPLVVFVDAPIVWEARRWGVTRPVWGRLVERFVEGRFLQRADLVLAVSGAVADEVVRLGVDPDRIVVTPCAVDVDRFAEVRGAAEPSAEAADAGTTTPTTVGWIGSFRAFHGLDVLIDAVAGLDPATVRLVLAGDGSDRGRIEALAAAAGIEVELTGALTAEQVPAFLARCDVGVVTSRGDGEFHYSPLKLREYLAAGLAVVAPEERDVLETVVDGDTAVLYRAGSSDDLGRAIAALAADPARRTAIGAAGARLARAELTWVHQFDRVAEHLRTAGLLPGVAEEPAGEVEGLVGGAGR